MSLRNTAPDPRWLWPVVVVLVTLLALGLRWYYVSTAMVIHPIRGDAGHYYFYALNLVHHGVFSGTLPGSGALVADSYRDPGYPLYLAFWMSIFGNWTFWYAAVLLSQALLGALTVACAMQLGRRWLHWGWVVAAGVLMAVWPHSITITSDLLTETLFAFLCTLALLLCARALDRRSLPWAIAAGACFGAAALTNAILLPFGVLLALYLAWRRQAARKVWVALLLAALVLPGAWAARNSQLPAQGSAHSSMGRAVQNLVQGSWPAYHAAYRAMLKDDPRGDLVLARIAAEAQLLKESPREGLQAIAARLSRAPWYYLGWYTLEKPWLLWGWSIRMGQNDIYVYPTRNSPFDTNTAMRMLRSVCLVLNPWLAALMLVAVVMTLIRRGPWRQHPGGRAMLEATVLLVVFVTLVYTVFQAAPRYSIPFRAFEMLLVMTTLSALARFLGQRVRQARAQVGTAPASNPAPAERPP